jgi:hypothetical protein
MTQYLVAIHFPDGYDGSKEDEAMVRDIDMLNEEMDAAGIRIFAGGLSPAKSAKSLRAQPDGKVLITDGPYLETKEQVGGFCILEAANMDEALEWGRKGAVACWACRGARVSRVSPSKTQQKQLSRSGSTAGIGDPVVSSQSVC